MDLPPTVVKGQEFDIIVRRIATRRQEQIGIAVARTKEAVPQHVATLPHAMDSHPTPEHIMRVAPESYDYVPGHDARAIEAIHAARKDVGNWRYVVGTFQIKIPVSTGEVMLFTEENTLAIMKWRLQQMPVSNRWYPVLQRYIGYLAARVDGLGGDSGGIEPSPKGIPPRRPKKCLEREYTGKICEVMFDCYGEFEGFMLSECGEKQTFRTRERGIGEIALRACRERFLVSVYVTDDERSHFCRIVFRC